MQKHKILICDDEEGIRESLRLILSDKYELFFAETGQEAIETLKSSPSIRALLLDIKMPKESGLDILKEIRSCGNDIPVIIITGYQSVEAATEAIKTGAKNYIIKPFESKNVLEAVEKVLS